MTETEFDSYVGYQPKGTTPTAPEGLGPPMTEAEFDSYVKGQQSAPAQEWWADYEPTSSAPVEFAKSIARGAIQGAASLPKFGGMVADYVRTKAGSGGPLDFEIGGKESLLTTIGESMTDFAEDVVGARGPRGFFRHDVGEGLGQIAPMLFGGAAAKIGTKVFQKTAQEATEEIAKKVGMATVATMGFAMESVDAFDREMERQKAKGINDPDLAMAKALGSGTVAGLVEARFGAGRILERYSVPQIKRMAAEFSARGVNRNLLTRVFGDALIGGLEEGVQRATQDLIVEGKLDPEGIARETGVGIFVQGPVNLPANVAAARQARLQRGQTEVAPVREGEQTQPANPARDFQIAEGTKIVAQFRDADGNLIEKDIEDDDLGQTIVNNQGFTFIGTEQIRLDESPEAKQARLAGLPKTAEALDQSAPAPQEAPGEAAPVEDAVIPPTVETPAEPAAEAPAEPAEPAAPVEAPAAPKRLIPAIRTATGIFTGPSHPGMMQSMLEVKNMEALDELEKAGLEGQGFVDETGKFYTREEAIPVFRQLFPKAKTRDQGFLRSEDLRDVRAELPTEVTRQALPTTETTPSRTPVEGFAGLEKGSLLRGARNYHYTAPDAKEGEFAGQPDTMRLPDDATPEQILEAINEKRLQKGLPAIKKFGKSPRPDRRGNPTGTIYYATAEDWARIQELQKQPPQPGEISPPELEALKNKYGGTVPAPPLTERPPNAPQERQQPEGNQPQYQTGVEGGQAAPASRSDSTEQGGQVAPSAPVAPVTPAEPAVDETERQLNEAVTRLTVEQRQLRARWEFTKGGKRQVKAKAPQWVKNRLKRLAVDLPLLRRELKLLRAGETLAEPPARQRKLTKRKLFDRYTEEQGDDILSWMKDQKLVVRSVESMRQENKKAGHSKHNPADFEGAPELNKNSFEYKTFMGNERVMNPNQLAQMAFDEKVPGVEDAKPDAFWDAFNAALNARQAYESRRKAEQALINRQSRQQTAWERATQDSKKPIQLTGDSIPEGSQLVIGGQPVTVVEVTPDEVILDGGDAYGEQIVEAGESIFVDSIKAPEQDISFLEDDEGNPPAIQDAPNPAAPPVAQRSELSLDEVANEPDTGVSVQKAIDVYGDRGKALFAIQNQIEEMENGPEADRFTEAQRAKLREVMMALHTGMGGAAEQDFEAQFRGPVSIKKADINEQRAGREQPPIGRPPRARQSEEVERVVNFYRDNPQELDRLVDELMANPRTLNSDEVIALDIRYVDLLNEYNKAVARGIEARDDGRTEDAKEAKQALEYWENRLSKFEVMARATGSEWGRSGAMMQRQLKEDYTLEAMLSRARAAKGFEPLTDEDRAIVEELHNQIQAAEKAYNEAQEKIAKLEAEKAIERIGQGGPQYDPRVLALAEKWVSKLEAKAKKSMDVVKSMLGTDENGMPLFAVSPLEPAILDHLAIIGAAKLARGILDSAKWAASMVKDLGEKVTPYLDQIRAAADKKIDEELKTTRQTLGPKKAKQIKDVTVDKPPVEDRIELSKDKISNRVEKGHLAEASAAIQGYVRELVEQNPNITTDELIDTVHEFLNSILPEPISRIEAMDAISGRGQFQPIPQDLISRTIRDLKTQIRLLAHQLDVAAGRPRPKTGRERDKLSDAARREEKRLQDLIRQFGIVVTDPEKQLAGGLNARKTYLKNRLSDLRWEIKTRQRIVKEKHAPQEDAELQDLRKELELVKAEHDKIFITPGMTAAQKLKLAIDSASRSLAAWNARLERAKKGDFAKPPAQPKLSDPTLDQIQAQRDAVKAEVKFLYDLANPKKTKEQIAIQQAITRAQKNLALLDERLANQDFADRPPRRRLEDPELNRLRAEMDLKREEFKARQEQWKFQQLSPWQKAGQYAVGGWDAARAVMTTGELSFILRQAGFTAKAHPIRTARAIPQMWKAFRNKVDAKAAYQNITSHPEYAEAKEAGLYIADPTTSHLSRQEEFAMGKFNESIPLVGKLIGNLNRAAISFLNQVRYDSYLGMKRTFPALGQATKADLKQYALMANIATGRGSLGAGERIPVTLGRILFSPRYLTSRLQLAAGQALWGGTARSRSVIAYEYARHLLGQSLYMGLLGLGFGLGKDDEEKPKLTLNPRSSDFGKIVIGDTRLDPFYGIAQIATFFGRTVTGETVNQQGDVISIRGEDVPYGKDRWSDYLKRFGISKAHPMLSTSIALLDGVDFIGNEASLATEGAKMISPITWIDIMHAFKKQNVPDATALSILAFLGEGLQTYMPEEKKPKGKQNPKARWQ